MPFGYGNDVEGLSGESRNGGTYISNYVSNLLFLPST